MDKYALIDRLAPVDNKYAVGRNDLRVELEIWFSCREDTLAITSVPSSMAANSLQMPCLLIAATKTTALMFDAFSSRTQRPWFRSHTSKNRRSNVIAIFQITCVMIWKRLPILLCNWFHWTRQPYLECSSSTQIHRWLKNEDDEEKSITQIPQWETNTSAHSISLVHWPRLQRSCTQLSPIAYASMLSCLYQACWLFISQWSKKSMNLLFAYQVHYLSRIKIKSYF